MATIQATIPAQGTAGTAQDQVIGEASFAGAVTEALIVPEAAVAANATNFRTFRVVNKGQGGAGTTVVASLSTAATSLVAFDEQQLTLSAVAGATTVAAGDVLVADETTSGTGVAHGGYTVRVNVVAQST
jgi:hypothetical protein